MRLGSGIPILDIQRIGDEDSLSSGDFGDDVISDSLSISKLDRDKMQDEDGVVQERMLSFALNDPLEKPQIQTEMQDFFSIEKVEEEEKESTPKFGDQNKWDQFKFIYRNEEKRIKFINDLAYAMKIWHHIHSTKNYKIKSSKQLSQQLRQMQETIKLPSTLNFENLT